MRHALDLRGAAVLRLGRGVREVRPGPAAQDLPHLGGVNVVIHELLGEGVAASTRFDPQAKGLGEWARSRYVDIPEELL